MKNLKKKNFIVKKQNCTKLEESELNKIIGSGNSQIRYISDEYIQARILKMQIRV